VRSAVNAVAVRRLVEAGHTSRGDRRCCVLGRDTGGGRGILGWCDGARGDGIQVGLGVIVLVVSGVDIRSRVQARQG